MRHGSTTDTREVRPRRLADQRHEQGEIATAEDAVLIQVVDRVVCAAPKGRYEEVDVDLVDEATVVEIPVARISKAVEVRIRLTRVRDQRAVVRVIGNTISIGIRSTGSMLTLSKPMTSLPSVDSAFSTKLVPLHEPDGCTKSR